LHPLGGLLVLPARRFDILGTMTPQQLRDRIGAAGPIRRALAGRGVDDIIDRLDAVVESWLQPGSPWMARALAVLPAATGFSAAMIAHGLPLLLGPLRGRDIRRLLDAELGGRANLDTGNQDGTGLILHILSGNIPALAAAPLLLSLALKRVVLAKPAAGDPLFPSLLVESIAAVDPDLACGVIVAAWRGGDRAYEDIAFAAADTVVASGSDAAIAAIQQRVDGRFIGHGHKVSFAAVARDELADRESAQARAAQLAYDVVLWDQQGCLSPQLAYVEAGGRIDINDFAELLGDALAKLATELPPRALDVEERAAVLRFRQEAQWQMAASTRVLASRDSTDWTITVEATPNFLPTCLHRCIRLQSIADLSEIPKALAGHRRYLEAAGIAVPAPRSRELSSALTASGVHRVCPLGTMQTPDLQWRQGGRPRVAEWVNR